jgi:serine protease AprX
MSRYLLKNILALGVLVASCASLPAQSDSVVDEEKLAPEFREMLAQDSTGASKSSRQAASRQALSASNGLITCLVKFKSKPGPAQDAIITARGGRLVRELDQLMMSIYAIPPGQVAAVAAHAQVDYVSPDRAVKAHMDTITQTVGVNAAWLQGLNGKGIGVAVIDSGFTWHWDLNCVDPSGNRNIPCPSRVIYNEDFTGAGEVDPTSAGQSDLFGHGTHVMGILGGNGNASNDPAIKRRIVGVAPGAHFLALKALRRDGSGSDSAVIAAINRAIQLRSKYNIRVMNLSLGRPVLESYTKDPLCQAVEAAWRAGIVVVVAAGNNGRDNSRGTQGYGTVNSPGNDPYVITVGAVNNKQSASRSDDIIATYSSKGPTAIDRIAKPDVVAPGNQIIAAGAFGTDFSRSYLGAQLPANVVSVTELGNNWNAPSGYFRLSGTSMATPVVSGSVALLLQRYPSLTPDQVKARLMKTAYKLFPARMSAVDNATGVTYNMRADMFTVGAGMLDLQAALQNTQLPTGPALSPRVTFNTTNKTVSVVKENNVLWGDVNFGLNVVWGDNVLWGDNVVWGDNVIWGDSTATGFNVLWGDTSPWGTSNSGSLTGPAALRVLGGGDR